MIKIAIGADHAGFAYKTNLIQFLKGRGIEVLDFGTFSEDSVDYPDFAHPVAKAIEAAECNFGVLICGTGNGVAMTANKHQAVRAALCWNKEIVELARQHNNANVLCLPARFLSLEQVKQYTEVFVQTAYQGGRHDKRLGKMQTLC